MTSFTWSPIDFEETDGRALPMIVAKQRSRENETSNRRAARDDLQTAGIALVTKELAKGAIPLRVCQGFLALPVQRTFFDSVNESDHQDDHEPKHTAKNGPWIEFVEVVPVDHSPRVHKHNLDIE
jgi:hypothetical protein